MTAIGKFLVAELNGYMVALLRSVATFLLCASCIFWNFAEIKRVFFSKTIWMRAVLSQSATTFWFVGLTYNALPFAISVSLSTPLFTTLAAIFLLKEKVNIRRWGSLIVGFSGVLLITVSQHSNGFDSDVLWIMGAVVSWALANIIVKKLADKIKPVVIIFFMMALMSVFSIPLAAINWIDPEAWMIPWLALMAVSTFLWQWFLITAFSKSEVNVLQPFEFSKLLFASILGWIFFGEYLSLTGWIGAIIIALSSFYIVWREKKIRTKTYDS